MDSRVDPVVGRYRTRYMKPYLLIARDIRAIRPRGKSIDLVLRFEENKYKAEPAA